MSDKDTDETFKLEIERKNFVRAAHLGSSLGFGEDKLRDIRSKALWQMAAVNRNSLGTKILANQYGYSKAKVKHILEHYLVHKGNKRALKSRYDPRTGKYLSFKEWMDLYVK